MTQFTAISVLFIRRKTTDPRNIYYRNKKKPGLGLDQGTLVGSIQIYMTLIDTSRTLTDNILQTSKGTQTTRKMTSVILLRLYYWIMKRMIRTIY